MPRTFVTVTLDPLVTETTVRFDASHERDALELDGEPASEHERGRVAKMLDAVRAETGQTAFAHVASRNAFPTAAGLASSASGFAALAAAALAAAGRPLDRDAVSRVARYDVHVRFRGHNFRGEGFGVERNTRAEIEQ